MLVAVPVDQVDETPGRRCLPAHQRFIRPVALRPAREIIVKKRRDLEKELAGTAIN
jgi:hypothetical protein